MSTNLDIPSLELIETKDCLASYRDSQELRSKVFYEVISFCKKYEAFEGELMCQRCEPLIEAGYFLSNLIDKIGFEVEYYKDE